MNKILYVLLVVSGAALWMVWPVEETVVVEGTGLDWYVPAKPVVGTPDGAKNPVDYWQRFLRSPRVRKLVLESLPKNDSLAMPLLTWLGRNPDFGELQLTAQPAGEKRILMNITIRHQERSTAHLLVTRYADVLIKETDAQAHDLKRREALKYLHARQEDLLRLKDATEEDLRRIRAGGDANSIKVAETKFNQANIDYLSICDRVRQTEVAKLPSESPHFRLVQP